MAFNVSTLPAYVQDNQDMLLKNFALVGSKGFVIETWSGELQIGKLHQGLEVFRCAATANTLGVHIDVR